MDRDKLAKDAVDDFKNHREGVEAKSVIQAKDIERWYDAGSHEEEVILAMAELIHLTFILCLPSAIDGSDASKLFRLGYYCGRTHTNGGE